jgi:hypothetical protein
LIVAPGLTPLDPSREGHEVSRGAFRLLARHGVAGAVIGHRLGSGIVVAIASCSLREQNWSWSPHRIRVNTVIVPPSVGTSAPDGGFSELAHEPRGNRVGQL